MAIGRRGIIRSAGAALVAAAALLAGSTPAQVDRPAPARAGTSGGLPPITVSPQLPHDLNLPGDPYGDGGGAPTATLDQAAAFAWQEFIALSWPAAARNGVIVRDQPGTECAFGDPDPSCSTRPLTWQTFRGKAEIFSNLSLGHYNDPPNYDGIYAGGNIPACRGFRPGAQQAWVNLDETSEISLTAMYAGASATPPRNALPNSSPPLIRFMAKANGAEFAYVRQINANLHLPQGLANATSAYVAQYGTPPAGATNLVSLPNNTIEIKAGWRQLGRGEDASRFHTTTVRYYEPITQGQPAQCYYEAVWALASVHIIQKTASAPYFIFATFEHSDNILTAGGAPTEDADGNIIATQACRTPDQRAPCPTTPTTVYRDRPNPPLPSDPGVPQVSLSPTNAAACTPGNRLYYLNTSGEVAAPTTGFICINARQQPIPPAIIAANRAAHAAITAYNRANGIARSPWSNYKLINVQFVPMHLIPPGQAYTGQTYTGPNIPTFYLSNSIVESNYTLQNFSGRLVVIPHVGFSGAKSDYASQFPPPNAPPPAPNAPPPPPGPPVAGLYYRTPGSQSATGYNMGGCMGCHGTAQRGGADFSFILLGGQVSHPEEIPQVTSTGLTHMDQRRLLAYFAH